MRRYRSYIVYRCNSCHREITEREHAKNRDHCQECWEKEQAAVNTAASPSR